MHIVSVGLSLLNWVNISNIFVTHSLKLKLKVNGQSMGPNSNQSREAHRVRSRIFESSRSRSVEVLKWQACVLVMWRMVWILVDVAKIMWPLTWHV